MIRLRAIIGHIVNEEMIATPLPPYRMVLVASPDYLSQNTIPTHPDELMEHNCIGFSQWYSYKFWRLEKSGQIYNVKIHPRLLCNTGESIRQAVLNGLGIALNSRVMFEEDIQAGRLLKILPDYAIQSNDMNILRAPLHPPSMLLFNFY